MERILSLVGDSSEEYRLIANTLSTYQIDTNPELLKFVGAPDLIIVDQEALQRWQEDISILRSREAPAAMPVLLLLPGHDLADAAHLIGHQVEDVMVQPFLPAELQARVNNLLCMRDLSTSLRERIVQSNGELRVLGRAFSLFSACNEWILRAQSEGELLRNTLEELVSNRGFRIAWVGLAKNDPGKTIQVLAQSGDAESYLSNVTLSWSDGPEGDGLTGRAIRSGKAQVCDDMQAAPHLTPWHDQLDAHGFAACLALPCRFDDERMGVLVLYSEHPQAFTAEEIELMGRLSENIAFGLRALRNHEALRQAKSNAELRAHRDALTGLPNRQWIQEQLSTLDAEADRHRRYAAVLFVDLDGFKQVNDSMGHEVGDRLLRKVAQRLQGLVREEDTVSRQGGDEFVILMPLENGQNGLDDVPTQEQLTAAATHVAERIVNGMQKPLVEGHSEHHLGASIGISLFPKDTTDALSLPSLADQAMYTVKRQGGNGYRTYTPDLALTHTGQQRALLSSVPETR